MNYNIEEKRDIQYYVKRYLCILPLLTGLAGLAMMITGMVFTFNPSGTRLTPTSPATIAWFAILLIYYSVLSTLAVFPKPLPRFLF